MDSGPGTGRYRPEARNHSQGSGIVTAEEADVNGYPIDMTGYGAISDPIPAALGDRPLRAPSAPQLSMALQRTVAMVLAGGQGERLSPLTRDRAKPAVPFGGIYRIIDFTLSNCINSGLRKVHVLTQYKSYSLDRHIKQAWSFLQNEMNEYIDVIPPQLRSVERWYRGTADALFQNIYTIGMERPDYVLILGGDHVYKMDYSEMLAAHIAAGADLTVACTEVTLDQARRMGVMSVDEAWRIRGFDEKPPAPQAIAGSPDAALASMGVYIFSTAALVREVTSDANGETHHDFGRDIIPAMVQRGLNVRAFPLRDRGSSSPIYWRDIGTIDSYYDANMDLVAVTPVFNLYDSAWPIRTYQPQAPPPKTVFRGVERQGEVLDSLVSNGCIISGARVEHCILGARVFAHSWAHVADSVVFEDVEIGRQARIRRAIIDKGVCIPPGTVIGYDHDADRARFTVSEGGVVVIPKGYRFD